MLRGRLGGWLDLYVQFLELCRLDRARRIEHQVLHALRLRKRDDVADVVRAREQHDDPVDARRNASVRRNAILERFQQKTETLLDGLVVKAQELKDAPLQVGLVDPQAAARELISVA